MSVLALDKREANAGTLTSLLVQKNEPLLGSLFNNSGTRVSLSCARAYVPSCDGAPGVTAPGASRWGSCFLGSHFATSFSALSALTVILTTSILKYQFAITIFEQRYESNATRRIKSKTVSGGVR